MNPLKSQSLTNLSTCPTWAPISSRANEAFLLCRKRTLLVKPARCPFKTDLSQRTYLILWSLRPFKNWQGVWWRDLRDLYQRSGLSTWIYLRLIYLNLSLNLIIDNRNQTMKMKMISSPFTKTNTTRRCAYGRRTRLRRPTTSSKRWTSGSWHRERSKT